jgi:tellurite resistance protein TerB
MGFLGAIKGAFGATKSGLDAEMARWKSKDAAFASLAIVALTAGSDGEVEPQERKAGADFVRKGDLFKAFDRGELATALEGYYAKATDAILKEDLIDVIRKVKGTDYARSVVRVGVAIANSDGEFEAGEKEVLREVCAALGLPPEDFKGL